MTIPSSSGTSPLGTCFDPWKHVKKGSKVYLEGQLQTRKWTDQSGNDKYTTEIVLGRYKGELQLLDSPKQSTGQDEQPKHSGGGETPRGHDDLDDEIPFITPWGMR